MSAHLPSRSGGRIVVDGLAAQGVTHAFLVPGESYLPVLDALHDAPITAIVHRHEGGAAMAAEAHGKLTGSPGVCLVTRGPGATNAASGLHVARQDSTPMVLLVGQVERGIRGREAFQELDYRAAFGGIAKWVAEADDTARLPELISAAFHAALSGRPGPAVLALPEDVLSGSACVADAPRAEAPEPAPFPADLARLEALLAGARAPLMLLGGSRWSAEACARITAFAERFALPTAVSFRRQGLMAPDHPCYAGHLGLAPDPALRARVAGADLVLLVGGRFSEVPSQGYELLGVPDPGRALVHVHPDPGELGRVYAPTLGLAVPPTTFAAAVAGLTPPAPLPWAGQAEAAHAAARAWMGASPPATGPLDLTAVMRELRAALPADAIVTNGAGNYAAWLHRFFPYGPFGTQLAPTSGSMGYGLPAAIAAKALHPAREVVALAGDGCFLMTGQELATAVRHALGVIVLVIDNGMYGTIRMHQERTFPGRVSGTDLANPDFAALARAYGAHGETVATTAEFAPALARARAAGGPALLHLKLDPEAITPTATLEGLRAGR